MLVPALALAYLLVWRRVRASRARVAALAAALALIVAAFVTPLERYALHTFLWAHLLQNVVLAEWAPALLVLAIPSPIAQRAGGFVLFRPLVALPLWIAGFSYVIPPNIPIVVMTTPRCAKNSVMSRFTASEISCFFARRTSSGYFAAISAATC